MLAIGGKASVACIAIFAPIKCAKMTGKFGHREKKECVCVCDREIERGKDRTQG